MAGKRPPLATYRLQLNASFTFEDARRTVPYLSRLGISHVYLSPCLRPRAGSPHGYDIVGHDCLNPELGDHEDFARLVDTLHTYGLGLILDIVPNHMGIGSDENAWWTDLLESGQASPYAAYFDIDWHPVRESLRGKVLLPMLGDQYGRVLEAGELKLAFDDQRGEICVQYYERRLPLEPETYPVLLSHEAERLAALANDDSHIAIEWHSLITAFEQLHEARATPLERARSVSACKQRLAALHAQSPAVRRFLGETVALFNGIEGQPESFDGLHRLLELQSFRLAYWRAASDEINYRRFFDINELVCLRQENPEVFDATHRLILALIADGSVDGLRIDHVDGLWDPRAYCVQLQNQSLRAIGQSTAEGDAQPVRPLFLLVEKILADYERLRGDWPVAGTTGYEFANLVNGLFVYSPAENDLTHIYSRFIGEKLVFDEVLYDRKRQVIRGQMSSGLTTLTNMLGQIAQSERTTRDYTLNGLREALTEVVAYFPVYRTYIGAEGVCDEDQRFIEWAVAQGKKHSPATDVSIFDFLREILLLLNLDSKRPDYRHLVLQFVMKFQQYTAPVMAKSLEDTAFYVYNRLVSLNEVGGDPRRFGTSVTAFHHANLQRLKCWPEGLITLATHDSKRSADVRARINVLSELAEEWRDRLARWRRLNRNKKRIVDGDAAPSRNAEYLLYQTLIGAWPLDVQATDVPVEFVDRMEAYMLKAVKEAKLHTSWINPNVGYETAVAGFLRDLLNPKKSKAFLDDFVAFQQRVSRLALYSSLSEIFLLLTVPGVPDIYQGTELLSFTLVDPDNRRPIDFSLRETCLDKVQAHVSLRQLRSLLEGIEDGRAKLFLIYRTLQTRNSCPELFSKGEYLPLEATGKRAEHLCAFARYGGDQAVLAFAPRWFARLLPEEGSLPFGSSVWEDTRVRLPLSIQPEGFRDVFSGAHLVSLETDEGRCLNAGEVLKHFPVALLVASI